MLSYIHLAFLQGQQDDLDRLTHVHVIYLHSEMDYCLSHPACVPLNATWSAF